ncbi:MAG: DUF1460 domain-containing protein [Syntrophaceae bacterium]|nr:DUF1460 domain-containing protein [Syntrophaceae bacterium]
MDRQAEDRRIFKRLISFLKKKRLSRTFPGEAMLEIGRFFLGTPYVAGTLESKDDEQVTVNLRGFDCVTFVENVVALTWLTEPHLQSLRHPTSLPSGGTSRPGVGGPSAGWVRSGERSFEDFRHLIEKVRYRGGRLQGYSSRLHYFSDWIFDNQKKGVVRDVTRKIGGRPFRKEIHFMTSNQDLYPQLKKGAELRKMGSVEKAITRRSLFFIPKEDVRHLEDRIRDGDLIAITTNRKGLDIQHVGLAARVKNRVHLLHASSREGKVLLSKETLQRYLMKSRARSGIMVARVS